MEPFTELLRVFWMRDTGHRKEDTGFPVQDIRHPAFILQACLLLA